MKDNNKNIELQTDNLITEKFHELLAANTKKLNDLRLEYAQRMADAQDDYDKAIDSVTIDEHLENDVLHIARKEYEKAREEYELNIRSLKKTATMQSANTIWPRLLPRTTGLLRTRKSR